MSGEKRTLIRQSIVDDISEKLSDEGMDNWKATSSRRVDARDDANLIRVIILQGTLKTFQGSSNSQTKASLLIQISGSMIDDDMLDVIGDYCSAAIMESNDLLNLVSGITPTGFEYPIEDDVNNDLLLSFSLTFC